MAELLLLGTGAALTDGSREPTMLALRGETSTVLIDCGSNPVRQLQRLGVPVDSVERVILTHAHPDHTSGFALLLEMLWLGGLRGALPVHGPREAIETVRAAFSRWDTSNWDGMPEIEWRETPRETHALIAKGTDFELHSAPGKHGLMPVIGVWARDLHGGGTMAYSADGEPSPGIQTLAEGVDVLVHEATGPFPAHSTAAGAAILAKKAGAAKLILVHLAPNIVDLDSAQDEAASIFSGPVQLGNDLDRIAF
jgi:ribonuclease Z